MAGIQIGWAETDITPNLIAQMRIVGSPLASPDGRWVAYVQDYNQRADIWVMPSGGGLPELVTADAPSTPAFTGGVGAGFVVEHLVLVAIGHILNLPYFIPAVIAVIFHLHFGVLPSLLGCDDDNAVSRVGAIDGAGRCVF